MRVLVTGASGFLGRAVVSEFPHQNHELFCLVSPKSKNIEKLPNILRADIRNFTSLSAIKFSREIDSVVHLAGLAHQFGNTPDADFRKVNVEGTKNVARFSADLGIKHFILISSVSVYGANKKEQGAIDETFECHPQGIYAESKYEAEQAAREICAKNRIALTILRPATIIGEGDRGNTARLIRAIDRRRFIWLGSGENRKSLIYKADAARACLKVLEKKTSFAEEIFNVTGESVKMKFTVSEIASALNRKVPDFKISTEFLKKIFRANAKMLKIPKISKIEQTVEKWLSEDIFSGERIAEVYGFRAETPISEALRRQVEFYRRESEFEK